MFQRYSEKARRVIFFARYEASQYGAGFIESEHILLGVLREDPALFRQLLGRNPETPQIREEIERQITRGERVSTSVEVPLSAECGKILQKAEEESQRLGDRHVGTAHLLLGMLLIVDSLAARILRAKGLKADSVREQLAKGSAAADVTVPPRSRQDATITLDSFLAGLNCFNWEELSHYFAADAQFIDAAGNRWRGRGQIEKQFQALFAPYAKKNVTFLVEDTDLSARDSLVVASILWENVSAARESTRSMHRMTVTLVPREEVWAIFLIQVTPIIR